VSENERFAPFAQKMQAEGLPEIVVRTFRHYYRQLVQGQTGLIPEADLEPVDSLPDVDRFSEALADIGRSALTRTVVVKLNGGLGTSMGLQRAKSLLPVKYGLSFLDIIVRQALQAGAPLILMNSFNTREETLRALQEYPELQGQEVPLDFVQHKVPKVRKDDLCPVHWPQDRRLEWCPPGHGDIYAALMTSGALEAMLQHGYEYAFVSNADNLGAVLEPRILGYFVRQELPFMMEVADRTEADRKGGHLARTQDGQLILRESAQCPAQDEDAFQDVQRHRYFNTNNLWLHLPSLKEVMTERDALLGLPMIRNEKPVDPRDEHSMPVYQLETAMGSAIGVFDGAGAVRVPRSRFSPVKTTNDLLAVRSDGYKLTDDFRVVSNPEHNEDELIVDLDEDYYRLVDQMEERFPYGPPSLKQCRAFCVRGDVRFGKDVAVQGSVHVVNHGRGQVAIGDGEKLTEDRQFVP
jgi:UTP--glucose-1-phosphate uridylyltransferase